MSQAQTLFDKDEKRFSECSGNHSSLKHRVNSSLAVITGGLAVQHLTFSICLLVKVSF